MQERVYMVINILTIPKGMCLLFNRYWMVHIYECTTAHFLTMPRSLYHVLYMADRTWRRGSGDEACAEAKRLCEKHFEMHDLQYSASYCLILCLAEPTDTFISAGVIIHFYLKTSQHKWALETEGWRWHISLRTKQFEWYVWESVIDGVFIDYKDSYGRYLCLADSRISSRYGLYINVLDSSHRELMSQEKNKHAPGRYEESVFTQTKPSPKP